MSEDGKNIVGMLQQLRRLCEELSVLPKTADAMMAEKDWKPVDTYAVGSLSYTLVRPRQWLPQEVRRFYITDTFSHYLVFLSVILDDWEKENSLEEPLLTAGLIDYGSGNKAPIQGLTPYARWHLQMPNRNDEGRLISTDGIFWAKDKVPFSRVSTLGVPLTSITNSEELKSKVIEPILQGIEAIQD